MGVDGTQVMSVYERIKLEVSSPRVKALFLKNTRVCQETESCLFRIPRVGSGVSLFENKEPGRALQDLVIKKKASENLDKSLHSNILYPLGRNKFGSDPPGWFFFTI